MIDQMRTGRFIAERRKGLGLTQAQLAERIGVGDKAVSKWETGKGLPEISALLPLCAALGINVNELLSGETLEGKDYSDRAEENMMNLMREREAIGRRNLLSLLALAASAGFMALMARLSGLNGIMLLDAPSLLAVGIPTALLLAAAGQWRSFWHGLAMAVNIRAGTEEERSRAAEAVALGGKCLLAAGLLDSLIQLSFLLYSAGDMGAALWPNLCVAMLTAVYGLGAYLLLLPLRGRLGH